MLDPNSRYYNMETAQMNKAGAAFAILRGGCCRPGRRRQR